MDSFWTSALQAAEVAKKYAETVSQKGMVSVHRQYYAAKQCLTPQL
jgi:hypothetical protein